MPVFEMVKAAAIQAAPVILDAPATTVTAEIDLKLGLRAKRWFDVVGRYKRVGTDRPQREGADTWPDSPASGTLQ